MTEPDIKSAAVDSVAARARLEGRLRIRTAARDDARRRERLLSITGFAVLVGGIILMLATADKIVPLPWWGALAALAGTLVPTIILRERATTARRRHGYAITWIEEGLARLDDQWRFGQADGQEYADPEHPFAADLDVFGAHSVYERTNGCATTLGRDALAAVMRGEAKSDLPSRQAAVRALADDLGWREAFAVELRGFRDSAGRTPVERETIDEKTRALIGWGDSPPPPLDPMWRIIRDFALGGGFLFVLVQVIFFSWAWWAVVPAYLLNFTLLGGAKDIEADLDRFEAIRRTLDDWARVIRQVEACTVDAPLVESLQEELRREGIQASAAIRDLTGRVDRLSSRRNMYYALTLDVAFLLDLHFRRSLLAWKRRHGHLIDTWLHASARMEALASLASYAAAVPGHAWPELTETGDVLDATDLAHPLLPANTRVGNDLTIAESGSLFLLTGSNMSGKSTFLRACGLAVVMARAGLPVSASQLRFRDQRVVTCMRTQDDLSRGSSRFHAEVRRLKECVDFARDGGLTLVLLDEILAGTNSKERHIGTEAVLNGLADLPASTLIATHDLELAGVIERAPGHGAVKHFRDQVVDGQMTFDYLLRDGLCPSTNALQVMRQEGLEVPE